jgi:predicted metal-dependent RNase
VRIPVIADSDYGYWRDVLGLPTTAEQDEACLFLEAKGYRFLVHFGFENAVAMAEQFPHFRQIGHA